MNYEEEVNVARTQGYIMHDKLTRVLLPNFLDSVVSQNEDNNQNIKKLSSQKKKKEYKKLS